jgi:hypothetical protein
VAYEISYKTFLELVELISMVYNRRPKNFNCFSKILALVEKNFLQVKKTFSELLKMLTDFFLKP